MMASQVPSSNSVSSSRSSRFQRPASQMSERPPRVLYVDDDAALARLVQRGLERAGYAVEVARDGATALERLTQGEIDAVALDHYLPTGTGLDLLKTMATRPPMPAVIYVTASDDASIAVAALKAGA